MIEVYAAARLSLNLNGEQLTMNEMFPKYKLRDITEEVDKRFFLRIPKSGGQVAKASMLVVGDQGCGKSVQLVYYYDKACKIYGKENINTIYTDDIRVALDLLDDKPVQLVIVDDAMTNASSREVFSQTEIIKVYNRSRHVYMERLDGKEGLILYIWAWQRFGELDPAFRQGNVLVFKSGIAEPRERLAIEGFLGKWYTRVLWQIWDTISRGNNDIKNTSVVRIASLDEKYGVGLYRSAYVERPDFPEIIKSDDYFTDESSEDELLDKLKERPGWGTRVQYYIEYRDGDVTQQEIAEKYGIGQGRVSDGIRKVRNELKKR